MWRTLCSISKAAAQQVDVAKLGLDLAQQALGQSQDRFAAGVTNNVEVIQGQQQLAAANEQYIASLYAHNIAKVLLARAIGNSRAACEAVSRRTGQCNAVESCARARPKLSSFDGKPARGPNGLPAT